MEIKDSATIGECYGPAMKITDKAKAQEYLEALVARYLRLFPEDSREQALACELSNLGYYAGYYSYETSQRVKSLYGAVHPIFGNIKPTPDEAFQAGIDMANKDD